MMADTSTNRNEEQEQWETRVKSARDAEPSHAQTAMGLDESQGAPAGSVTEADACAAPNAEALAGTLSADAELVDLARAWVDAERAWWASVMTPPFNEDKGLEHRQLADASHAAWVAWADELRERGIVVDDRRALAKKLAAADPPPAAAPAARAAGTGTEEVRE